MSKRAKRWSAGVVGGIAGLVVAIYLADIVQAQDQPVLRDYITREDLRAQLALIVLGLIASIWIPAAVMISRVSSWKTSTDIEVGTLRETLSEIRADHAKMIADQAEHRKLNAELMRRLTDSLSGLRSEFGNVKAVLLATSKDRGEMTELVRRLLESEKGE